MFLRTIFILLLLAGVHPLFSQTYIGQRETVNFDKKQYNAGTQNWKIKQDAQGRVYFANNEGVLVFDGAYWQLYPLPNKTIVRSIEFGKDKKLYAGGQDEMGYFTPGKNGQLTFNSLKNLLPKADQNFSDIWDIVSYGDDVFFRSHDKIFRYSNGRITIFNSTSWLFLGLYQEQLIAHDEQKGVLIFKNGNWQTYIEKSALPNGFYITNVCRFGENASLVTTAKNGVYILTGNQLKHWDLSGFDIGTQQAFSAVVAIGENNYLLSTYTNGIYQVDGDGNVIEKISKKEGLQNTNVRCLFMDVNHNIWLGLDNGIDFIAFNNAVKHINPLIFKDGSGFSMARYKNALYFSMSTGIYQLPLEDIADMSYTKNNFKVLADGLSWHLSVVNDDLLAGRDDGFFRIADNKLYPIYNATGFWLFEPLLNKPGSTLIAAGNYYGVRLFERTGNNFVDKGNIGKYDESARFLAIDEDNNIWTSHPTRGVYKVNADNGQVKIYTQAQGLPSTLNNFVFKIKNRVVIATEKEYMNMMAVRINLPHQRLLKTYSVTGV